MVPTHVSAGTICRTFSMVPEFVRFFFLRLAFRADRYFNGNLHGEKNTEINGPQKKLI